LVRLIVSVRREHLDRLLFWNKYDLQNKLNQYQKYFNEERAHSALKSQVPKEVDTHLENNIIPMNKYKWRPHCNDLFQLPIAA